MNKFFHLLSIYCLIAISLNTIQAQTSQIDDNSLEGSEFGLPPLNVVLDSVLKRSAGLNFRKHHIGVKESTLKTEKIYWTRNFGFQAETKFGNLNSFSTDSDGAISSSSLVTTQQATYFVGAYIKFPVFDLLNRKNQVKLAKLEIDEAKSMAQSIEDEIRQTVIKMYQNLILKQKILKIKSKAFGDGKVNMQMVEKEFRNGVVPVSEYVRITSITSNVEVDYEFAKSEFITAKKLLEDMAGFTFYQ